MNAATTTGVLPSLNATVRTGVAGYGGLGVALSGTFTGTVTFQGSVDGTTFDTLQVTTLDGSTATTSTGAGQWTVRCAGLGAVQVKMTSYSSGTCDVVLHSTEAAVIA